VVEPSFVAVAEVELELVGEQQTEAGLVDWQTAVGPQQTEEPQD